MGFMIRNPILSRTCLPRLFLILCLNHLHLVTSKLLEKDVPRLFKRLEKQRNLRGRVTPSSAHKRPALPLDVFGSDAGELLPCGHHVPVASEGYKYFKLQSPDKECSHAFLGSYPENCTVAILCKGSIAIQPSDCRKGYLILFDGTAGFQKGCGKFSFSGIPRFSRNGGNDLYVEYKGTATNATCVAFCKQDLTEEHFASEHIRKEPKTIHKNLLDPPIVIDQSCTCGIRNTLAGRIVGGEETGKFEFPWLAAITYSVKGYERIPYCAASLISDLHLVTAAHCLQFGNSVETISKPEEFDIILHAHTLQFFVNRNDQGNEARYVEIPGYGRPIETDKSENTLRLKVERIIVHPLFSTVTFDWDIAVLKLATRVNIRNKTFSPICLPEIGEYGNYPKDMLHTVAGWGHFKEGAAGATRFLQKLDIPLGECTTKYNARKRHICAGFVEGGKDSCRGDSGGPLIYNFRRAVGQYLLSGVVSAGVGCARPGRLGLYTSTQELVQWIYYQTARPDTNWCRT